MDLINKNDVKTVGCIGAGPIGAGWVAYFLSQGLLFTNISNIS